MINSTPNQHQIRKLENEKMEKKNTRNIRIGIGLDSALADNITVLHAIV